MTVGYLFDLDRTLVTYEPDAPGIFRAACRTEGVEPSSAAHDAVRRGYVETLSAFEGNPYLGAAEAARTAGLDVEPAAFAASYVDAELSASRVPDGLCDLLASVDRVGVVSNGYGPVQRRKLAETGLDRHVDAVVCPDDVGAFKPDDAPFDAVTDAVPADDYVMVGDSVEYDIRPAANRGYRTVYVGTDDPGPADDRVSTPADLPTHPAFDTPAGDGA